jgi:polygalacturonase
MKKSTYLIILSILMLAACEDRDHICNIRSYGARADGQTLNTRAIQKAIDACNKAGGGTVLVPPGEFVTGTIFLKSNVNLYLEQGAVLLGSLDTLDYQPEGVHHGMIYAFRERNITISGEGEIYGRGTSFHNPEKAHTGPDFQRQYTRQGEAYMPLDPVPPDGPIGYLRRPGMMIVLVQCEQVVIKDVTLRDSPEWTIRIGDCDDVVVHGISIHNNLLIPNSDGIHCTTSRNIRISDCDIRAGDDAIIVTGFGTEVGVGGDTETEFDYTSREFGNKTGYAENVAVTNCVLQSRSSGIRIGYGANPIRNCTFSNLIIYGSNRGIGVFSRDEGTIENILFSDVVISNRLHSGHWWGNGEPIHVSAVKQDPDIPAGAVINVSFRNITAQSETGIMIYGTEESPVKGLRLENIRLQIQPGSLEATYGGNFDLRPVYTPELAIFKHDIPALYSQFTKDMVIEDLQVNWGKDLPDYWTNALYCTDFSGLTIDGFIGTPAHPCLSAIELINGSDLTVTGLRPSCPGVKMLNKKNIK